MKMGSLATLVALIGSSLWIGACDSDGTPSTPSPEAGADGGAGTGGKGMGGGGAAGKAGGGGTGGTSSGGMGGFTTPPPGGTDGGPDASADGGAPEAGAVPDGATPLPDGSFPDGGGCADHRCDFPEYFAVQYPAQNPGPAGPNDDAFKAKEMLGKFLFFEEQIGELDNQACGTCHRANAGGSDPRTYTQDQTLPPRTGEGVPHQVVAHLPGPDNVLDPNPANTSDDIRGAMGVLLCSSPGVITGTIKQVTTRKPPSYFDAMFAPRVFWDGRAGDCKAGDGNGNNGGCFYDPDSVVLNANAKPLIVGVFDTATTRIVGGALEQQSVGPPLNPTEMACTDQTWAKIEAKLATVTPGGKLKQVPTDMANFQATYSTYPKMFAAAFGSTAKVDNGQPDNVINSQRIAFAIATHERRLTSNQTPFDKWRAGDLTAMTDAQVRGYKAYIGPGRCATCHPPPLFTDNTFHNIGFHKPAWDEGRKVRTGVAGDIAKFKTPTLRNVGLREQFGLLHEGEGPGHNLDTVMQLYKQGGFRNDPDIGPNIDLFILDLTTALTSQDMDDIKDFLRNALTDPRVKNETAPFDRPKLSTE